ncbi:hypothetical protein SLEP1_g42872 [Rubroshorea leprosula]|uniref:Uncharacterized protein n=1 Tax=Rubroshorea leprosula TaxID=152421 RepID=A0AAV5LB83_9ROSI|nr:hypothetical protein SLEP1_g42872 [Rubroshorea leprosula]
MAISQVDRLLLVVVKCLQVQRCKGEADDTDTLLPKG